MAVAAVEVAAERVDVHVHHRRGVGAVDHLMAHDELEGAFNLAAPHPLPQGDFMRALRAASGTRVGLPATAWMVAIGAFLLQTETELPLKSRRVVPARLLKAGFPFRFPDWSAAADDLVRRWRQGRAGGQVM